MTRPFALAGNDSFDLTHFRSDNLLLELLEMAQTGNDKPFKDMKEHVDDLTSHINRSSSQELLGTH